jgi:hypothetical protein
VREDAPLANRVSEALGSKADSTPPQPPEPTP